MRRHSPSKPCALRARGLSARGALRDLCCASIIVVSLLLHQAIISVVAMLGRPVINLLKDEAPS